MKLRVYTHDDFLQHDTGAGHPERVERLNAMLEVFREPQFSGIPVDRDFERSDKSLLTLFHDEDYIDEIRQMCSSSDYAQPDPNTVISAGSYDAACRAVGAMCKAVDDCFEGITDRAFCAVRPPGHHAQPGGSDGFCVFNSIAIAALYARQQHNLERIAIVDFDVHHGNGVQKLAEYNHEFFYISTHQWPLYPGTGKPGDNIENRIMNIRLAGYSDPEEFREAYESCVFPALHDYKPELILLSSGFDAHIDDHLASLMLTDDDFGWVTEQLVHIADEYCTGKIVSVLEGGYNLDALKNCVRIHIQKLAGI